MTVEAAASRAGTTRRRARCLRMSSRPPILEPDERTPEEEELARRSHNPTISLWLVIGALSLLALVIYVASAVLG